MQESVQYTQADLASLEQKLSALSLTLGEAGALVTLVGGELKADTDVPLATEPETAEADVQGYIIIVGGKPVFNLSRSASARTYRITNIRANAAGLGGSSLLGR